MASAPKESATLSTQRDERLARDAGQAQQAGDHRLHLLLQLSSWPGRPMRQTQRTRLPGGIMMGMGILTSL